MVKIAGYLSLAGVIKKESDAGAPGVAQSVKLPTSTEVMISRHDLNVPEFEPHSGLYANS